MNNPKITHSVEGLPDVYTIVEYKGRFIPKLRGRTFNRSEPTHGVAWFKSLEDATKALHDFLRSMQ